MRGLDDLLMYLKPGDLVFVRTYQDADVGPVKLIMVHAGEQSAYINHPHNGRLIKIHFSTITSVVQAQHGKLRKFLEEHSVELAEAFVARTVHHGTETGRIPTDRVNEANTPR